MMRVWCLFVAYIGPKLRTKRPRKTKIGTELAHVTRDSETTFKVKRSKVNLQGRGILRRPPAQLVIYELFSEVSVWSLKYRLLHTWSHSVPLTWLATVTSTAQAHALDVCDNAIREQTENQCALCNKPTVQSAPTIAMYHIFLFFPEKKSADYMGLVAVSEGAGTGLIIHYRGTRGKICWLITIQCALFCSEKL